MPIDANMLFDEPDVPRADEGEGGVQRVGDGAVERVARWFRGHADLQTRFSSVFRQSLDEVLDGQRTGRYDVNKLEKTEKTYLGTKVEIVCRTAFNLPRGKDMDYEICGHEVDAKFSLKGDWMIPGEAMGKICLLMTANDELSTFRVGLVRISQEVLRRGDNKDGKRQISASGRSYIKWLYTEGRLQGNLLLGLDPAIRRVVEGAPVGQNRVDELFRHVHRRIVDRTAVVTYAKQLDAPKRVRDARRRLAPEGVIILGHQKDSPHVAKALRLPIPDKGAWVATRVVPASVPGDHRPVVFVDGVPYVEARPDEAPRPAPSIDY